MSTNDPARPKFPSVGNVKSETVSDTAPSKSATVAHSSRRTLLTSAVAGLAAGGTAYAAQSAAAAPDPIFALIEVEHRAFDAWGETITAHGKAEEALWASEWRRKPRVLVGECTIVARRPDFVRIPLSEQVVEPIYAHDHAEIDRDCDSHAKAPGATRDEVEARRARLHRELDEDGAAIAAAPEVVREAEAEKVKDAAYDVWAAARDAVLAVCPNTAPGLLALIDLAAKRTEDGMDAECFLDSIITAVRAVVGGRA